MNPKISIIMRSWNDIEFIEDTLRGLYSQSERNFELISLDNDSDDGTLEVIKKYNATPKNMLRVKKGEYVPGIVLNRGVRQASGKIIVFMNSDVVPQDEMWLANLIEPLEDKRVGAVFGRQLARPGSSPAILRDHLESYPDKQIRNRGFASNKSWEYFFSMASSATRTDVLREVVFNEDLQYSEDIEWAVRVRQAGLNVVYAKDSRAYHSHEYDFRSSWKRFKNEGIAEAQTFKLENKQHNLFIFAFLPFVSAMIKDIGFMLTEGKFSLKQSVYSVKYRYAQKFGRYIGIKEVMCKK